MFPTWCVCVWGGALVPSPKAVGLGCVPPFNIPLLLPLQIPCSRVEKLIIIAVPPHSPTDSEKLKRKTQSLHVGCCPLSRGYSDIFYTYVGSGHFLGFSILNFNIYGGFQKNEYFWGYEILWIFFWGITKFDYI